MKLLILTQKVDKNDSVLGFFHGWLLEFSKHFEHLTVICLEKGGGNLPENVEVLSLGKEKKISRFAYVFRFYKYIWGERNNYDTVFVHMNQEYLLLGWILWKLWGKKIILWRNHNKGSFLTDIAVWASDIVCCTSKFSYTAKFKKTQLMPVGIDENMFKRDTSIQRNSWTILSLGRISPVKKIDVLIDALILLDEKEIAFKASIYGDTPKRDQLYYEKLKQQGAALSKRNKLEFYKGVSHKETPQVLNAYEIFVNLTPAGSFDKTILEAMACEAMVVFSNDFLDSDKFQRMLTKQDDPVALAQKLEFILKNPSDFENIKKQEREYVVENHSLSLLTQKIVSAIMA
ncbi:MAG: glycosyltransferase family 4 protein [Candidatus Pacebacteria bacterium]|nr:glycosyltransferase family 4 protein [Candidatus Paceibacterota bacterium]